MGRPPDVLDIFHHVSIAGASHREGLLAHFAGGVAHHGHLNVVEGPDADEFLLASKELQLALFAHAQASLNINELLGRHGEGC